MATRRVLFLCTGNYYRSRFAERLFNHLAGAIQLDWVAESAGLVPECRTRNQGAISIHTLAGLRERSVAEELAPRLPRDVTLEALEVAERVIALKDSEHRPLVRQYFPEWESRLEYWEIDDVDLAPPSLALGRIEVRVQSLISELGDPSRT